MSKKTKTKRESKVNEQETKQQAKQEVKPMFTKIKDFFKNAFNKVKNFFSKESLSAKYEAFKSSPFPHLIACIFFIAVAGALIKFAKEAQMIAMYAGALLGLGSLAVFMFKLGVAIAVSFWNFIEKVGESFSGKEPAAA